MLKASTLCNGLQDLVLKMLARSFEQPTGRAARVARIDVLCHLLVPGHRIKRVAAMCRATSKAMYIPEYSPCK